MALSTGKGHSTTIAGCAETDCDVSTLTCTTWQCCRHCHAPHSPPSSLRFFHLSEGEASYCSAAIKCNAVSLLRHNLFLCSQCQVAEFPGTKNGGLTLNIDGYLYDVPTHHFLKPDAYHFTHLHNKCSGVVTLLSVRLSREEATHLGRLIRKTPTIEASRGAEVEPFTLHHTHRSNTAPLGATTSSSSAASASTPSASPPVRLASPWVTAAGRCRTPAELRCSLSC